MKNDEKETNMRVTSMKTNARKKYFASYEPDADIRQNVRQAVWRENLRSTNFFLLTGAVGLVLCALSPLFYEKNIVKAAVFLAYGVVCFIVYLLARYVSGNNKTIQELRDEAECKRKF